MKRLFNLLVIVAVVIALVIVTPVCADSEKDSGSSSSEYIDDETIQTSFDEWSVNYSGNSNGTQIQNQKSSGTFTVTNIDSGTILYESFYDARSHVGISSNGSYNVESTEGSLKWLWIIKDGEVKTEQIWIDGEKIR